MKAGLRMDFARIGEKKKRFKTLLEQKVSCFKKHHMSITILSDKKSLFLKQFLNKIDFRRKKLFPSKNTNSFFLVGPKFLLLLSFLKPMKVSCQNPKSFGKTLFFHIKGFEKYCVFPSIAIIIISEFIWLSLSF